MWKNRNFLLQSRLLTTSMIVKVLTNWTTEANFNVIHCGVFQNGLVQGAVAKVVSDFRALRPDELHVRVGDIVTLVRIASRGCLVRLCYEEASTGPEGWVPAHVLSTHVLRKPWMTRLKKSSGAGVEPPAVVTFLHDIIVAVGDRAQLSCRIRPTRCVYNMT